MTYKARYIHRRQLAPEYWRTITGAESVNHAMQLAERWTRKGFICVGVMGGDNAD